MDLFCLPFFYNNMEIVLEVVLIIGYIIVVMIPILILLIGILTSSDK